MTANTDDGSINLHSTQLGLNRAMKHNFLEQSYLPTTDKDASLKHFKFKTIHHDDNSIFFSRKGYQAEKNKPLFTVADLQPQPEQISTTVPDEEKNSDGLLGGLFDLVEEVKTNKP